jgi:hypothetical protein
MNRWIHFALIALLFAPLAALSADPPTAPNPCKTEVVKFEEAIGFIRQHQGVGPAAALKEKLLPAKVEAELLATEGYCGLARYLREKKLDR